MPRFDASRADCHIFTFKEGLLSAVAHDLKLRVGRFEVQVESEPWSVSARFEVASLEVVCAMKEGREDASILRAAIRTRSGRRCSTKCWRVGASPR